ncbi:hypothetical protein MRX96_059675 [Rhipicephalus microplus]
MPRASPMLEAEHPGSAARRLCITEDFHGRPWDKPRGAHSCLLHTWWFDVGREHLAIMSWYWDVVRQCWTLLPPLAWSHPYALPLWTSTTTEPCISGRPRGASSPCSGRPRLCGTSIDLDATEQVRSR